MNRFPHLNVSFICFMERFWLLKPNQRWPLLPEGWTLEGHQESTPCLMFCLIVGGVQSEQNRIWGLSVFLKGTSTYAFPWLFWCDVIFVCSCYLCDTLYVNLLNSQAPLKWMYWEEKSSIPHQIYCDDFRSSGIGTIFQLAAFFLFFFL